jgi:hypothetical protein
MNQIARRLNAGGDPDARILAVADAVSRTNHRIDAVLAWLDSPPQRNDSRPQRNDAAARRPAPPDHRNASPQRTRPTPQRPPGRSAAERHERHEQRHP